MEEKKEKRNISSEMIVSVRNGGGSMLETTDHLGFADIGIYTSRYTENGKLKTLRAGLHLIDGRAQRKWQLNVTMWIPDCQNQYSGMLQLLSSCVIHSCQKKLLTITNLNKDAWIQIYKISDDAIIHKLATKITLLSPTPPCLDHIISPNLLLMDLIKSNLVSIPS